MLLRFLYQTFNHLKQRVAEGLALGCREVVGGRQGDDSARPHLELRGDGCPANRAGDHRAVARRFQVEHRAVAQPAGQFFKESTRRVLRNDGFDIFAVGRPQRGPTERIARRSRYQRVAIQSGKCRHIRMADIGIREDDQYAAPVQQQLELHLPLSQQLGQTEVKRARFPGTDRPSVRRLHVERACCDALDLL